MDAQISPTESAVIVRLPELEPIIGDWRSQFDRAAQWGVPAHVTLLYPFVPPGELTAALFARLDATVASVPAFEAHFGRTGWFAESVLWLEPEPAAAFRHLDDAVCSTFPDVRPYGGEIDEVVLHATVGQSPPASPHDLRLAERAVRPSLPVCQRIDHVETFVGAPVAGSWRRIRRSALAGPPINRD